MRTCTSSARTSWESIRRGSCRAPKPISSSSRPRPCAACPLRVVIVVRRHHVADERRERDRFLEQLVVNVDPQIGQETVRVAVVRVEARARHRDSAAPSTLSRRTAGLPDTITPVRQSVGRQECVRRRACVPGVAFPRPVGSPFGSVVLLVQHVADHERRVERPLVGQPGLRRRKTRRQQRPPRAAHRHTRSIVSDGRSSVVSRSGSQSSLPHIRTEPPFVVVQGSCRSLRPACGRASGRPSRGSDQRLRPLRRRRPCLHRQPVRRSVRPGRAELLLGRGGIRPMSDDHVGAVFARQAVELFGRLRHDHFVTVALERGLDVELACSSSAESGDARTTTRPGVRA